MWLVALTLPGRDAGAASGTVTVMENEKIEAVQAVVERVGSYQEGAPEGTVEKELRSALAEAEGVELDDAQVTKLAEAIEAEHGIVDVRSVLA